LPAAEIPITFVIFDVLSVDGQDVRREPYRERRRRRLSRRRASDADSLMGGIVQLRSRLLLSLLATLAL